MNEPERQASNSLPRGSAPPATMAAMKIDKKAIKTLTGRDIKKKPRHFKEYRGMGNGHYYLALGPTHALFYEDD